MSFSALVRNRNSERLIALVSAVVVLMSLMAIYAAPPARAIEGLQLDIPISTVVHAGDGTETELAREDVPSEYVGQQCTVTSIGQDQESVHLGNDLVVSSGGSQVVVPDVERSPGAITVAEDSLVLGSEVVVVLRMGSDEVFSAGLIVRIDCQGDPSRIVVVKEVTEGSDASQEFEFEASYDSDGFSLSDGESNDSGELDPGTYEVSELVPQGWSLQSATCDDGSPVDAIEVSAGETVTCTFTNDEVQVGALILVTVEGTCEVSNGVGQGEIDVTVSVAEGATVTVTDSSGDVVGTFTSDGTLTVPEGATYTWEATPSEGFEFPAGFEASGTITIDGCTPDEVLASIQVTVSGFCELDGDEGEGFVDVSISVPDGATVVVRDSDGDVVGTVTDDATLSVPEGATYTWEATASEGFEFPPGFDSSGTITIERCSDPETLPFTGFDPYQMGVFAILLMGAGVAAMYLGPREEGA